VILFGGLYLTSAALVLAVAAVVCRVGRVRAWWAPALVAGGAALAACVALGNSVVDFPALTWVLAAAAFAAVSVATWAWFRFVEEPA
jgi:hypothetical protein